MDQSQRQQDEQSKFKGERETSPHAGTSLMSPLRISIFPADQEPAPAALKRPKRIRHLTF